MELGADTEAERRRWAGSQTAALEALTSFLFRVPEEKKKVLIFLVSTHSSTMNRNMIEISTSHPSRLTFKANAKGLKTHSR